MKILALESSTSFASVCLSENEKILAEFSTNTKLKHSHTLMSMTEYLLKCSKCNIKDIDLFACSTGPGSFTGIRVSISAVKGIAMALSKPCVGVSSLHALACSLENDYYKDIVCLMDARCNRFYFASFKKIDNFFVRTSPDSIVKFEDLTYKLKSVCSKKILLLGDAANMCYNKLKDVVFCDGIILLVRNHNSPHARGVIEVSREKFLRGEITSSEKLVASYFSLPKAQRELEAKMKENNNE